MEELAARFEATQEQARRNESGHVAIDLVLASMGNTISESLDGAERAARRGAGVGGDGDEDTGAPAAAALRALRRATSDIDTFEAEVVRQQKDVEYALALRAKARDALKDCNEQFRRLDETVRETSALDASPGVQRALRAAASSVRYATARLDKPITTAWMLNDEASSEQAALDDAKVRIDDVESLVVSARQQAEQQGRDHQIAQSTLDLALSKLEGLARTVSDSGVDKEGDVQRAMQASEAAYLSARKRFNVDKRLDPAVATSLVQVINDADVVTKRVEAERNEQIQEKETAMRRVSALAERLASVCGLCDASGTLVVDQLQELMQGAREAVNSAVRLSGRGGGEPLLDSAIAAASRAISHLELSAKTTEDEIANAEKEYLAARENLEGLTQTLRISRSKTDSFSSEQRRSISTLFSDAEASIHLFRLHMQGVKSWLEESAILEELMADAKNKVEVADEEVERMSVVAQVAKHGVLRLAARQRQLQNRHEHVCTTVQYMKTVTPPDLSQAISATDRAMSQVLVGKFTPHLICELENLIKGEEDILESETHNAEKRTVDMEKAATKIPIYLQKLASLDAKVEAAGVHVAALVDAELGEAHRAVRSIEHSLEADMKASIIVPLADVDSKIKSAEVAVTTQVRRIANASMAQQEAKTQLSDLEVSYDELSEEATTFSAFADRLTFESERDWSSNGRTAVASSPAVLSKRIISNAILRSESLIAHARRRVDVPVSVWMEYGPKVAQNALDSARESIREAKMTVDAEQAKVDSNDTERKCSRAKLEDCSQNLASIRAQADTITNSADISIAQESIDGAEHAVNVAFRALANGTIASSSSAMSVALRKASEAEMLCTSAVKRSERVKTERKNVREQCDNERAKLDAAKESAVFLGICDIPAVANSLSMADRALVAVDLVLKCEFGLPMLRSEFQAAAEAVQDFSRVVEREKSRAEVQQQMELRKRYEERVRHQRRVALQRARSEEEVAKKREMQDKLDAAIHQLQLRWPAVVDVQNSMTTAEAAVEVARQKLLSGGLPAAKAAVSMALSKIRTLNQTAIAIEKTGAGTVEQAAGSDSNNNDSSTFAFDGAGLKTNETVVPVTSPHTQQEDAISDLATGIGLLQKNLEEVNLTISKQKEIMQIQSKLISAANGDVLVDDVATLRIQLSQLQGTPGN